MLLLAALFASLAALAQGNEIAEYEVKAAFLYKFTAYIEWPRQVFREPGSPLVFGVLGNDEVAENLRKITAGRKANGHPVEVRTLHEGDALADVQVLFIGRSTTASAVDLLSQSALQPVLTVTEAEDWDELGSVINFVVADNRVRFDVSLKSASRNRLKISARLLSVARNVVASPS